jgi:hypothetical protein
MAIDFPANPSLNDTYTTSGRTWRFNGTGWAVEPVTLTAGAIIAGLGYQPVSPLGNAATATAWQTPRTLTVGSTGKAVDGSAAVAWSLSEIGALPAAGGTLTGNLDNTGTGYIRVSVGTTAQRPGSPAQGMIRFNTSRGCFEGYTGSAWVNMSPLNIDDIGATA